MTSSVEALGKGVLDPDLVAAVLSPDPGVVHPETVIVIGIPAPSRPGSFKLFRDIRMTWAVEGQSEAIRAGKVIPEEQVPLGLKCVALWVDAEAELTHTCAWRSEARPELPVDLSYDDVPFLPIDLFLWPPASQFGTRIGDHPDRRVAEGPCRPDPKSPTGYSQRIAVPGLGSRRFPCEP